MLDRHLELLGEPRTDRSPVRRLDGSTGRLDLHLSAAATEHDRNHHLVVELKAPSVKVTSRELGQIKSYAMAVLANPRFASSSTVWDFWLITGRWTPPSARRPPSTADRAASRSSRICRRRQTPRCESGCATGARSSRTHGTDWTTSSNAFSTIRHLRMPGPTWRLRTATLSPQAYSPSRGRRVVIRMTSWPRTDPTSEAPHLPAAARSVS